MDRVLSVRCFDACRYTLLFPEFFMDHRIDRTRKIFRWLFQFGDWYPENVETIAYLDQALPRLTEETKAEWQARSSAYQHGYRDPDLRFCPPDWTAKQKNAALVRGVREAKAAHKKATRVYESYQDAKNRINEKETYPCT